MSYVKQVRRLFVFIFFVIVFSPVLSVYSAENDNAEVKRNEQRIYIPYGKIDDIFGPENRGILMPYEDFLKLWKQIPLGPTPTPEIPPPVDAMIAKADYEGSIIDKLAIVSGTFQIKALRKGWSRLPLSISGAAITNARISPGNLYLTRGEKGYELALQDRGEYTLHLDFTAAISDEEGTKKLNLFLPEVPVSSITLTLPEPDLKVNSLKNLPISLKTLGNKTEITILNSGAANAGISWRPSVEKAQKVKPILFATDEVFITIGEGFIRNRTKTNFQMLQAPVAIFQFNIPEAAKILEVETEALKTWQFNDETGILTVELFQEKSNHLVEIEFENSLKDITGNFQIPFLQVMDIEREKGVIAIGLDAPVSVHPVKTEGVTQIGLRDFRSRVASTPITPILAYRFIEHPLLLSVETRKLLPEIFSVVSARYTIQDQGIDSRYNLDLRVTKSPVFQFRIQLPDNMERIDMGTPEERARYGIDDFRVRKISDGQFLEVDFGNPVLGNHSFEFTGWIPVADYGVLLELPMVRTESKREIGYLGIASLGKFKVTTSSVQGLFPVSLEELRKQPLYTSPDMVMGYRYHQHPVAIKMDVAVRPTKLTAVTLNRIKVEEDIARIHTMITYTVEYNGLERFQFRLPAQVGKDIHVDGESIKEKIVEQDDDELEWTIILQSPVLGSWPVSVTYDWKLEQEKPKAGKQFGFAAPRIMSVERDIGYVAVTKEQDLEVTPEIVNLERIDPKEIPVSSEQEGIFLAYRYFTHPYSLDLTIIKHDYEKILDAIINRCQFTTVLTKEYHSTNELIYEIQNKGRQFLELVMPDTAKIMSLSVDGKQIRHSRRESDGMVLVPLSKTDESKQVFYIRMVYENSLNKDTKMGTSGVIHLKTPEPRDMLIQKTRWNVYLPFKYKYFPPGGNMNRMDVYQETGWELNKKYFNEIIPLQKRGRFSQGQLVTDSAPMQIYGGSTSAGNTDSGHLEINVIKEGYRMTFSKLDGPGNLRIRYMGRKLFAFIDFLLFAIPLAAVYFVVKYRNIPRSRALLWGLIIVMVLMAFVHPFYLNLLDSSFYAMILVALIIYVPGIWQFLSRIRVRRTSSIPPPVPGSKSQDTIPDTSGTEK